MIECDLQSFKNVSASFRLAQLELGSSPHDLATELDEILENLEQRKHLRPATNDREHDDAEGRLQLGMLVKIVEDDFADLAPLQVDDDTKPVPIRLVADVGDAIEDLLADQFGDAFDQAALLTW